MRDFGLLIEYESVLLKKRKDFSPAYMGVSTLQKEAVELLRFAFEELLQWTPEMIRDYLSKDLVNLLHLQKPINRIEFPPELNRKKDLYYLAWLMYPETVNNTKKNLVLCVYQKVLDGDLVKFPKNFFSEAQGELNACICFQYAISQNLKFESTEDLYDYFTNYKKSMKFLKQVRLSAPCIELYEYPIDMLHFSLPASQQNELAYYYGRFITDYDQTKQRRKKA